MGAMGTPADDVAYLLCAEDPSGAFQPETAGASAAAAAASATSTAPTAAGWDTESTDGGDTVLASDDEAAEYYSGEEVSIAEFISGEAEHSPRPEYYPGRLRSRSSVDPAARADSVAWILKMVDYHGFLPLTAYLAVSYMDRFLSLHAIPGNGWAMQLLAVTCLSLAAKMEETLALPLLDLQANREGTTYIFEPRTICRMELLVLNALDWRLHSITPFTFIYFFACKVDPTGKHRRHLIDGATRATLTAIHDMEILDHCPSSIAAAAVLCACSEIRSIASPINPETMASWCIGLDEGAIGWCYQLMQQLMVAHVQRESTAATTTTTTVSSEEAVSSYSSSSSSPPLSKTKRRRWEPDT